MNKSEVSGVVVLDLKKALDLVDHDILLQKLTIYLKNSSFLPFFKSYLHNRTQCVLLHSSYSRIVLYKISVTLFFSSLFFLFFFFLQMLVLN